MFPVKNSLVCGVVYINNLLHKGDHKGYGKCTLLDRA